MRKKKSLKKRSVAEESVQDKPKDAPDCFGKNKFINSCIRCPFLEPCLYRSHKDDIKAFKTDEKEIFNKVKDTFLNENILSDLLDD